MVQGAVLDAVQHRQGPSWIGLGSAMDRTWMSLGCFLDDLETDGSCGTRTKQELPANDCDPAGNLSHMVAGMFTCIIIWVCGQQHQSRLLGGKHGGHQVPSQCRLQVGMKYARVERLLRYSQMVTGAWYIDVMVVIIIVSVGISVGCMTVGSMGVIAVFGNAG